MCDTEKDITRNKETWKTNASLSKVNTLNRHRNGHTKPTPNLYQDSHMIDQKYSLHLDTSTIIGTVAHPSTVPALGSLPSETLG
jgi:hypothetical protein